MYYIFGQREMHCDDIFIHKGINTCLNSVLMLHKLSESLAETTNMGNNGR